MISKITIFAYTLLLSFFLSIDAVTYAESIGENNLVTKVVITGLSRTDSKLLKEYLGLDELPVKMSHKLSQELTQRLMKTGIYNNVQAEIISEGTKTSVSHTLLISCDEKWTTVPVLRAEYGGGTPMFVLGFYDINSFGRLVTFGAEMRRYGRDDPGGVVYLRSPYLLAAGQDLALDFWRETRTHSFYDFKGIELARTKGEYSRLHSRLLLPAGSLWPNLKFGLDFNFYQTGKVDFSELTVDEDAIQRFRRIDLACESSREGTLLPMMAYDNVRRSTLDNQGLRLLLKLGAHRDRSKWDSVSEMEVFYYRRLGASINLMLHGFGSSTKSRSPTMLQFLGGFNSVRGLKDGAMFGHHAVYSNMELRRIVYRREFLWIQAVAFTDSGMAFDSPETGRLKDYGRYASSSIGGGFRFAIPQVYRLVLRIDYAVSVNNPRQSGVSLGLNQFIQPYRPL